MMNNILMGMQNTDRSLIESILQSFYILDYGFINKVNPDKTVNVSHAKQLKTTDGKTLPPTISKNIEVLTIAGAGFSINFDYQTGDKVLLLGLKNYIKKVNEVTTTTETKAYLHYTRETLKAIPLCVFNDNALVKIGIEKGVMDVSAQTIKLNGDSKNFVTWAELNQALSTFLTQLTTALTTTPIAGNGAPQPSWTGLPTSIDISAAKTTTVVTGG